MRRPGDRLPEGGESSARECMPQNSASFGGGKHSELFPLPVPRRGVRSSASLDDVFGQKDWRIGERMLGRIFLFEGIIQLASRPSRKRGSYRRSLGKSVMEVAAQLE